MCCNRLDHQIRLYRPSTSFAISSILAVVMYQPNHVLKWWHQPFLLTMINILLAHSTCTTIHCTCSLGLFLLTTCGPPEYSCILTSHVGNVSFSHSWGQGIVRAQRAFHGIGFSWWLSYLSWTLRTKSKLQEKEAALGYWHILINTANSNKEWLSGDSDRILH